MSFWFLFYFLMFLFLLFFHLISFSSFCVFLFFFLGHGICFSWNFFSFFLLFLPLCPSMSSLFPLILFTFLVPPLLSIVIPFHFHFRFSSDYSCSFISFVKILSFLHPFIIFFPPIYNRILSSFSFLFFFLHRFLYSLLIPTHYALEGNLHYKSLGKNFYSFFLLLNIIGTLQHYYRGWEGKTWEGEVCTMMILIFIVHLLQWFHCGRFSCCYNRDVIIDYWFFFLPFNLRKKTVPLTH